MSSPVKQFFLEQSKQQLCWNEIEFQAMNDCLDKFRRKMDVFRQQLFVNFMSFDACPQVAAWDFIKTAPQSMFKIVEEGKILYLVMNWTEPKYFNPET